MTQFAELFKPEILFSTENPFLKGARKTHFQLADSFDKAARLQLSFAQDLLDLNRKRIDALYAGESFVDAVTAHQDLATELGKRTATWVGGLKEIVVDLQSEVTDAANDLAAATGNEAKAAKGKKAKAA